MNRTTSLLAGLIFTGTIAALAVADPQLSGHATVVDGDSLNLPDKRIRLWGISAPEWNHPNGAAATQALRYMLARDPWVTCKKKGKSYDRVVAECWNSEGNLGKRMVSIGWATDWVKYSRGAYKDEQESAKKERLGIWNNRSGK